MIHALKTNPVLFCKCGSAVSLQLLLLTGLEHLLKSCMHNLFRSDHGFLAFKSTCVAMLLVLEHLNL